MGYPGERPVVEEVCMPEEDGSERFHVDVQKLIELHARCSGFDQCETYLAILPSYVPEMGRLGPRALVARVPGYLTPSTRSLLRSSTSSSRRLPPVVRAALTCCSSSASTSSSPNRCSFLVVRQRATLLPRGNRRSVEGLAAQSSGLEARRRWWCVAGQRCQMRADECRAAEATMAGFGYSTQMVVQAAQTAVARCPAVLHLHLPT